MNEDEKLINIKEDTEKAIPTTELNEILKKNYLLSFQKIEDKIFSLSETDKEKLKTYSLKELSKVKTSEFNTLYNKLSLQIPSKIWTSPSELIHPEDLASLEKNKANPSENENIILQKKEPIPSIIQSGAPLLTPNEQKIYGLLYCYHVLSSKTPILEKNPAIWALQVTFLKIKSDYLKNRYPQTRAMRNFNPWNLRTSGDLGKDKGNFAIFSTLEKGWKALLNNIERRKRWESKIYRPNFSLLQFFTKYADPRWARNYAIKAAQTMSQVSGMNISPTKTPIKNIPTEAFATAIAEKEDGNCYKALKNEGFIK